MDFKKIDAKYCHQLLKNKDVTILDIRDQRSFIAGHMLGAKHIEAIPLKAFITQVDQTSPLVIYCYHGISSQNAARYFIEQGFSDVYSLDGGYEAWVRFEK